MTYNKVCNSIKSRDNPNDKIYTPKNLALDMIDFCDIQEGQKVLDPCKGGGVFYDNLPDNCEKYYCEIDEGIDFFDFNEKVDLIIGNPPYSIWTKWINHTCNITDKFCYVFGTINFTPHRLKHIEEQGFGMTKMILTKVDWWFGHCIVAVFEKNKSSVIQYKLTYPCDFCGKRCKRGRMNKGVKMNPNVCSEL